MRTGNFVQILGMHRSGTSCLAGSLEAAGLYLGQVNRKAGFNLKGNREYSSIVALHDTVLAENGFAWDAPPPQASHVNWTNDHIQAQIRLVENLRVSAGRRQFGFKDPRSLLLIEKWEKSTPLFVASFRHPDAVASSLANRAAKWGHDLTYEMALDLWNEYNHRLLALWKKDNFPLIKFGRPKSEYFEDLQAICRDLDLPNIGNSTRFYSEKLTSFDASEQDVPEQCQELWHALEEIPRPSSAETSSHNNSAMSLAEKTSKGTTGAKQKLSFVIVCFDMKREVPRTVLSCLPFYQIPPHSFDIEVIVVDNGSIDPINKAVIKAWPSSVKFFEMPDPNASPAKAINFGVSKASGNYIGIIIDGARMLSNGMLKRVSEIIRFCEDPFIATLGYHLGDRLQQENQNYNRDVEDTLLESINWPDTPEKLFEISCLSGTSKFGILGTPAESNVIFMKKSSYVDMKGFDERFESPGGGFTNLEFFNRGMRKFATRYFLLTDQGSFHQTHGGVSTDYATVHKESRNERNKAWKTEYEDLTGIPYSHPKISPILFGEWPKRLVRAMRREIQMRKKLNENRKSSL